MARTRLNFSVGRQRVTKLTRGSEAAYVSSIREAMNQILRNYESLIKSLGDVSAEVLMAALRPTFELSQKYCPVDTGLLKASGFLEVAQQGKNAKVVMGYAKGGRPEYAAYVHEITYYKHASPTRAKFLLTALEEDAPNIQQRIIAGYKQAIGST